MRALLQASYSVVRGVAVVPVEVGDVGGDAAIDGGNSVATDCDAAGDDSAVVGVDAVADVVVGGVRGNTEVAIVATDVDASTADSRLIARHILVLVALFVSLSV